MTIQSSPPDTLRQSLQRAQPPASSVLADGVRRIRLQDVLCGTSLGEPRAAFDGASVLVAVETQLEAALALMELDGVARRLILLPPDVKGEHLPAIIRDADVDTVLCSNRSQFADSGVSRIAEISTDVAPCSAPHAVSCRTEWLMLTSGTTGDPKIAIHTLAGLTGAIAPPRADSPRPVWATFYDVRRYGGLQIYLRAIMCGGSLVLSQPGEAVAGHLSRLAAGNVSHVSGTPTHWRRALMSGAITQFRPSHIRLSGEIADQAILDALRDAFPDAAIGHAYASTEAGVGFEVNDGLEGFPASYLGQPRNGVEMRITDGVLRIRSPRMASGYAGRPDLQLTDAEGWVDTGDMVDMRDGRCHFAGRRGGIINVGGLKVHPEEVETVINRHGAVRQSRVKPRKSPIIGSIVVADVVLREGMSDANTIKQDILDLCRSTLPAHKIPAIVNVVNSIEMTAGGKVSRHYA